MVIEIVNVLRIALGILKRGCGMEKCGVCQRVVAEGITMKCPLKVKLVCKNCCGRYQELSQSYHSEVFIEDERILIISMPKLCLDNHCYHTNIVKMYEAKKDTQSKKRKIACFMLGDRLVNGDEFAELVECYEDGTVGYVQSCLKRVDDIDIAYCAKCEHMVPFTVFFVPDGKGVIEMTRFLCGHPSLPKIFNTHQNKEPLHSLIKCVKPEIKEIVPEEKSYISFMITHKLSGKQAVDNFKWELI